MLKLDANRHGILSPSHYYVLYAAATRFRHHSDRGMYVSRPHLAARAALPLPDLYCQYCRYIPGGVWAVHTGPRSSPYE